MDRDRLKEVHTSDLTESRLNEDFVDWLKTKGPSWLLVILIAVVAYLAMVRYRESKVSHRNEAWNALLDLRGTALPGTYEDIAKDYEETDGIGLLARMAAADRLLLAVQSNRPVGSLNLTDPNTAVVSLTPEERDTVLGRADRLFAAILQQIGEDANISPGLSLHAIGACSGRAAVAEAQGDADGATKWYAKAEALAGDRFPHLAAQARGRIDSLAHAIRVRGFPAAVLSDPGPVLTPATIDPAIRSLIDSDPGSWNPDITTDGSDNFSP